jgi:catechol 2,3-dioxygenase-like lactoylglutathione lyase family enzyme
VIGWIHHATLRVRDVEEALARWSLLLGLSGERAGEGALLRCAYEDYCLELLPAGDSDPGLEHVAWELRAGTELQEAADLLAERGGEPSEIDVPDRGAALRVEDPEGNAMVIMERRPADDRTPPVTRFTDELPAFHPRKLGHVNFLTADVKAMVAWYEQMLGFRVTDWIAEEGCWLHVNRDHHVIAFSEQGYPHIHHLAFELVDWGEMRVALDHLGQHRRPLVWGPGRHAMAQNLFAYWRMPEEDMFVELFCDLEQLDEDHEVRHFPDDPHASNVWGILPPRSYFRFDEEAIRSEGRQEEARPL